MSEKPYRFVKDDVKKTLKITAHGMMQEAAYPLFMEDLKEQTSNITVSDYNLVLDSSDFPVQKQEAIPMIKGILEFYQTLNFNHIVIKSGGNVIPKMQMKRILRELGMEDIIIED